METMCHCGKPLHYIDEATRALVETAIAEFGENTRVHFRNRIYSVPRHFIALHGLKGKDIPSLGFPEVTDESV